MGLEGTYLNTIKAVYDKPTASTTLNGQKLLALALRSGTRQGCLLSPLLFNISTGSHNHSSQTRRNKRNPNGKEVKLSLFADDMILYMENPKYPTKKTNRLVNELSKVEGYKINIQISITFFIHQ